MYLQKGTESALLGICTIVHLSLWIHGQCLIGFCNNLRVWVNKQSNCKIFLKSLFKPGQCRYEITKHTPA